MIGITVRLSNTRVLVAIFFAKCFMCTCPKYSSVHYTVLFFYFILNFYYNSKYIFGKRISMYTPLSLKWNMMPFDRYKNQFASDCQNFCLRKHRKLMLTKRTLFLQKHFLKMDRLLFVIVVLLCLYVTQVVSAEGKIDDKVIISCRIVALQKKFCWQTGELQCHP